LSEFQVNLEQLMLAMGYNIGDLFADILLPGLGIGKLLFARAFDVSGHRLDLVGRQVHRHHLILAVVNGVGDLLIDVALPEFREAKIARFGVEGRSHGTVALSCVAMARGTFFEKNRFAILSPTAICGPQDNHSQEQSGHCPEN
jgi:hypothetical protein